MTAPFSCGIFCLAIHDITVYTTISLDNSDIDFHLASDFKVHMLSLRLNGYFFFFIHFNWSYWILAKRIFVIFMCEFLAIFSFSQLVSIFVGKPIIHIFDTYLLCGIECYSREDH